MFSQTDKAEAVSRKLPNNIIDNPSLYMAPRTDFAVAAFQKYVLYNGDYNTLSEGRKISNFLMEFIAQILMAERKDIQIETLKSNQLVTKEFNTAKLVKITATNFMCIHLHNEHFCLIVVNSSKKIFTYIDPYSIVPQNQQALFNNFQNFMQRYNESYPDNPIESEGWCTKNYNHPLQDNRNNTDCGVYVLKFIRDLIDQNKIQTKEFDVAGFRKYLQHYILQHSVNMINRCIVCGYRENIQSEDEPNQKDINWTRCDICKRWCHNSCTFRLNKKGIFLCVVCKTK